MQRTKSFTEKERYQVAAWLNDQAGEDRRILDTFTNISRLIKEHLGVDMLPGVVSSICDHLEIDAGRYKEKPAKNTAKIPGYIDEMLKDLYSRMEFLEKQLGVE